MENAERSRWVASLGDLLRHTDTPMGRLMRENPSNVQLLGSGLRAGTLRSRVRSIRKFLEWLSAAHKVAFPVHWQQLIEFLQVRLSEPCVRGSLKAAHRSFLFLQESAGISDKFTDSALYDVARKELFAAALPGRAPRQAPRFPSILLGAFEDNVMDSSLPVFWRVLSWWLVFQAWSTLRFDDHRGIVPQDLEISETGLVGKLSRSKVTGQDKRVAFRVLVIHPSAFVHQKDWLSTGWALLVKEAPYARDYLLPAPANKYCGLKTKELTYHTAFAVQSQIVSLASYRGLRIFRTPTSHYYTPHSGRNFMPTATAVLGLSKSDRDMLGGWAAEGSERYSQAAKFKIGMMQKAVSSTFGSADHDPLAEADDLDSLGVFLNSSEVSEEEVLRTKTLLVSRTFTDVHRDVASDVLVDAVEQDSVELLQDE